MAADLGLIAHAAEGHAHELAVGGARDALAERGLADARRTDQAEDRALELLDALLHGEILHDALLHLLQPVVILVEYLLGAGDVLQDLGALLPRHLDQPVDVVAHHGGFRRHGRHHLQLVELAGGLLPRLFRHAGARDLLLELGDLVATLVHLAELFLNGLHLLIQVVLALALLHLRLDAAADALLDLQHVHLALDGDQDVLEALTDVENLQHLLLLAELERHVRRNRVGEPSRVLDPGKGGQHLRRDLLVELHVLLELRDDRAREHVHLPLVVRLDVGEERQLRRVVIARIELVDAGAVDALDEHLDRAVRQLQQLQDRGHGADAVEILPLGVIDVGLLLRDQHDALVAAHGHVQRLDGFLPPYEQRNHHVGINDDVPQRQHGYPPEGCRSSG